MFLGRASAVSAGYVILGGSQWDIFSESGLVLCGGSPSLLEGENLRSAVLAWTGPTGLSLPWFLGRLGPSGRPKEVLWRLSLCVGGGGGARSFTGSFPAGAKRSSFLGENWHAR